MNGVVTPPSYWLRNYAMYGDEANVCQESGGSALINDMVEPKIMQAKAVSTTPKGLDEAIDLHRSDWQRAMKASFC